MKYSELQQLPKAELEKTRDQMSATLREARFLVAVGENTKVHELARVRKTIARINTLLANK